MYYLIDPIIEKILKDVELHRIGAGDYSRWIRDDGNTKRYLGSNPYGCADAANILYTLGSFPKNLEERSAFVAKLQSFQDEKTGVFSESTHPIPHTTAHCAAALELFDARPKYPLKAFKDLDKKGGITDFLRKLNWEGDPWGASHHGAGVFAAKVICEAPSLEWQNEYFQFLCENCDSEFGFGLSGAVLKGEKPQTHHLNGWFHYLFNFNHCHRAIPHPEALTDSLIREYLEGRFDNHALETEISFRSIDWVFSLNRASAQSGHRRHEAKEAIRLYASRYLPYLENADLYTHGGYNDLHSLFGAVCCLSELCLALPGEVVATVPLKNVLDRRPFI